MHNRISYLRQLIISLAEVRYIDRALLVFSHDYYDQELLFLDFIIIRFDTQVWSDSLEHFLLLCQSVFNIQSDLYSLLYTQVHNRISYLRQLIISLAEVRYIDRALLVFSHDYYDQEINKLVKTIDFCKLVQVFYPHSLQFHPKVFKPVRGFFALGQFAVRRNVSFC